ncbi:MAG: hypothetical protein ABMB14_38365 [Myxococcota bacterium]
MDTTVLEIVRFALAAGVDPGRIEAAAAPVTDWLRGQAGFRWRTLAAPAEGGATWTDVVGWASADDAHAAAEAASACPAMAALMPLLDPASVEIVHLPIVHQAHGEARSP